MARRPGRRPRAPSDRRWRCRPARRRTRSRSIAASTLPAVTHEMPCSLERPPKTTATRGLRRRWGARSRRSSSPTLSAYAGRRQPTAPDHRELPWPGHRRGHRRSSRARARRAAQHADHDGARPTSRAATVEYGRYGNPTWTALEEARRRAGGRPVPHVLLRAGSGRRRCSTWSAPAARWSRPAARLQRHDHAAGRPRVARAACGPSSSTSPTPTRSWPRAPTPPWCGWSRRPTRPRGGRHRHHHRGRARGRCLRRGRQHLRHSPAADARSRTTSTWSCTRRPSTSPGTATCCSGAICTRDDELWTVLKGRRDLARRVPGTLEAWLALRGLRTLHLRVERAQANAQELVRRLGEHPAVERGPLPGLRRHRHHRARPGRDGRRPAHPQDAAVGARHLARRGASRPSSAAGAGRPSRRPSPRGSCGCRSASRTSRTCGTTCAARSTAASADGPRLTPAASGGRHGNLPVPTVRVPMTLRRSAPASVRLGLGVARDEGVHHLQRRDPPVDDGVDVLGDGGVDTGTAGQGEQRLAGLGALGDLAVEA